MPRLSAPVKVRAGGGILQVDGGHLDPWVCDFDGDGKRDLLVGQFMPGKLRFYRNLGSNNRPRFDGFTYVKAAGRDAAVLSQCCIGFNPQVVDVDGDGRLDLVSGEYNPGDVQWFPGTATGFAWRRPIPEASRGSGDLARRMSTVHFLDWDGDGDMDFLTGSSRGQVFLCVNQGRRGQPSFGRRIPLMAGKEPVSGRSGRADPFATDWDGDRQLDVLVGDDSGRVMAFLGRGDGGFEAAGCVIPDASRVVPGFRPRIHVTDWNGDGRLDLLVGTTESAGGAGLTGFLYVFLRK
jgi:hypothetical protein